MWFVEQNGNKIGHIPVTATSGSDISEIALPTAGSVPTGITAGSDNALVFHRASWKSHWSHSNERDQHVGHYGDHAAGRQFAPSGSARLRTARSGSPNERTVNSVAHMPVGATLPSQITSITMPTAASGPLWIAPGAAGTMIVSEAVGAQNGQRTVGERPPRGKSRSSARERRTVSKRCLAPTERFGSPRSSATKSGASQPTARCSNSRCRRRSAGYRNHDRSRRRHLVYRK